MFSPLPAHHHRRNILLSQAPQLAVYFRCRRHIITERTFSPLQVHRCWQSIISAARESPSAEHLHRNRHIIHYRRWRMSQKNADLCGIGFPPANYKNGWNSPVSCCSPLTDLTNGNHPKFRSEHSFLCTKKGCRICCAATPFSFSSKQPGRFPIQKPNRRVRSDQSLPSAFSGMQFLNRRIYLFIPFFRCASSFCFLQSCR